MRFMNKIGRFAVIAALLLIPTITHAQLTATAPVTVSLNVTESISASCTPTSTSFTDVTAYGGATTTAPVTCQASWALASTRTHLDIAWVLPGGSGAFLTSGSNTLTPAQLALQLNITAGSGAGPMYSPVALNDGLGYGFIESSIQGGTLPAWFFNSSVNSTFVLNATVPASPIGSYTGTIVYTIFAS